MPLSHEKVLALVQQSEGLTDADVCAEVGGGKAGAINALLQLTTHLLQVAEQEPSSDQVIARLTGELKEAIDDATQFNTLIQECSYNRVKLKELFKNQAIRMDLFMTDESWVSRDHVVKTLRQVQRTLRLELRNAFALTVLPQQALPPIIQLKEQQAWSNLNQNDVSLREVFDRCFSMYLENEWSCTDLDQIVDLPSASLDAETMCLFVQTFAACARIE